MPDDDFIDRCVARIRDEVPDAVAILLGGSYLRGDAGPDSDVDFDVLVVEPRDEWPSIFDVVDGRLVRISVWIRSVDGWLASADEPQDWAFFLPSTDRMRLCWAADDTWRQGVDRASIEHPAGPPEIDHFEGEVGKVVNAFRRSDDLALRLAAQDLARSIISLLQPFNLRPPVQSRIAALRTVLDFDVVPAGYRGDILACLALDGRASTSSELYAAATRLTLGVLDIMAAHPHVLAPLVPADAAAHLVDGSLRRYIEQVLGRNGSSVG
ncbi:MAG TPA: nucleotidyltransferase domain-containing protein [Micromonosporaceae bacterium]|nr:nucleotidyltransferase domain-containing protein [Micromonosporaceae bacterium]